MIYNKYGCLKWKFDKSSYICCRRVETSTLYYGNIAFAKLFGMT